MQQGANKSSEETNAANRPAIAVGAKGAVRLHPDGVVENLDLGAAAKALSNTPHIICNAPLGRAAWGFLSLWRLMCLSCLPLCGQVSLPFQLHRDWLPN